MVRLQLLLSATREEWRMEPELVVQEAEPALRHTDIAMFRLAGEAWGLAQGG